MSEFNPYEHLKASTDASGQFIYEYLENNGLPVHKIGPDGKMHRVMVVKRYLATSGYRQWFYSKYPEGSMDVEDLTPNPIVVDGKFVEYPSYKIKVSLYADHEKNQFIANGIGVYSKTKRYNPLEEYTYIEKTESNNNYLLTQSIAIKNAMANAGFVFDINEDILNGEESQFMEYITYDDIPCEEIPMTAEAHVKEPAETAAPQVTVLPSTEPEASKAATVVSKGKEVPAEDKEVLDPVTAFLKTAKPEETATEEAPQVEPCAKTAKSHKDTVFAALEGAKLSPKMQELVGIKVGELSESDIRYFARKDMTKFLTEETIDAIAALA